MITYFDCKNECMEKESLKNEVKFLIGHPYIGS
jgi:hypothetical protein